MLHSAKGRWSWPSNTFVVPDDLFPNNSDTHRLREPPSLSSNTPPQGTGHTTYFSSFSVREGVQLCVSSPRLESWVPFRRHSVCYRHLSLFASGDAHSRQGRRYPPSCKYVVIRGETGVRRAGDRNSVPGLRGTGPPDGRVPSRALPAGISAGGRVFWDPVTTVG